MGLKIVFNSGILFIVHFTVILFQMASRGFSTCVRAIFSREHVSPPVYLPIKVHILAFQFIKVWDLFTFNLIEEHVSLRVVDVVLRLFLFTVYFFVPGLKNFAIFLMPFKFMFDAKIAISSSVLLEIGTYVLNLYSSLLYPLESRTNIQMYRRIWPFTFNTFGRRFMDW